MDDSIRFAGQAGISSLYHYQDFQPGAHADRLADILKNHRVYCSNPAAFNDPWDCKPYFDLDSLDDPAKRAATAESLIANQAGGPKGDRMDEILRTDPVTLKEVMHLLSQHLPEFATKAWGVYCLSSDPCSTLMWSHYSRNHKGICLEFVIESTKFLGASKVHYQKEYPQLSLPDESKLDMLRIKSDVWFYEEEYRLICPRFTDISGHPLLMDGDYLSIDPNDLKSIIIGCQAADENIKAIKTLIKEHAPNVAVRRAVRAPNKYRLVIEG